MHNHTFLFAAGQWYGEGKISLSLVEEELHFTTNWNIATGEVPGRVQCSQEISIQGVSDNMRNDLTFYDFHPKGFVVDMENQNVGRIAGAGIVDEKTIAWEFRNPDANFEGYETYIRQDDGSYLMKGEYVTSDQFRTQIEARLWPQKAPAQQPEEPREDS